MTFPSWSAAIPSISPSCAAFPFPSLAPPLPVPTICSIGVRGEFNHTDREYAIVETLFERAEILTNAVVEIEEFEKRIS